MPRKPGWKWSEEIKQKMRKSGLKAWTPERRKKASEVQSQRLVHPMTGHKQSDYQKTRVSEVMTGKPKTKEHRKKIRENWSSLTEQEKYQKLLPGLVSRCKTHASSNRLEKRVARILRKLRVPFLIQQPFYKFIVDIYIPSKRVVLECDDSSHTRKQLSDIQRDKFLRQNFKLKIYRIKEIDIEFDVEAAVTKIMKKAGIL